jgi:cobalt-zinc-cadmium efflux system outer membrane protein
MQSRGAIALVAILVALCPPRGRADENALTLDRALALARERTPLLLAARARIEEARGRLAGASVFLRENPSLEGAAGRRRSDGGDNFAGDVAIVQTFELGGHRRARIDAAEADVAGASAASDEALRRSLRDVALAFQRALHAGERVRLLSSTEGVAADVVQIAERRYRADDVPILDVNLARAALARARSERASAEAGLAAALGELRLHLGMRGEEALRVEGRLGERRRMELAELLLRAGERSDLRELDAELRRSEAEVRLAHAEAWPDVGLGARYERDEGDDVVLGALTLSVPLFERAQGPRAESAARARRARLELEARRRAVDVEVRAAFEVAARRAAAVEELESNALPVLDENERLSRRSYEAGQIGLAELLFVRRETLQTRLEYLDRLLEAADASVDLEASAGALP